MRRPRCTKEAPDTTVDLDLQDAGVFTWKRTAPITRANTRPTAAGKGSAPVYLAKAEALLKKVIVRVNEPAYQPHITMQDAFALRCFEML